MVDSIANVSASPHRSASAQAIAPASREEARRFADGWAAAWNRRDLPAVLHHFAEDTVFRSPRAVAITGQGSLQGKEALTRYWEQSLAAIGRLHFEVDDVVFDPATTTVIIQYRATIDDRQVHAAEALRFGSAGLVTHGTAYYGAPVGGPAGDVAPVPRPPRRALPSLDELGQLPLTLSARVEPGYLDDMGHMNVAYYIHLFDRATWALLGLIGLDRRYIDAHHAGAFAAEQHVRYLSELRLGDRIEVRTRLLSVSARRIHFMHFMSEPPGDGKAGRLAARVEIIGVHVDLDGRRATRFPAEILGRLEAMAAAHQALPWDVETTIRSPEPAAGQEVGAAPRS